MIAATKEDAAAIWAKVAAAEAEADRQLAAAKAAIEAALKAQDKAVQEQRKARSMMSRVRETFSQEEEDKDPENAGDAAVLLAAGAAVGAAGLLMNMAPLPLVLWGAAALFLGLAANEGGHVLELRRRFGRWVSPSRSMPMYR